MKVNVNTCDVEDLQKIPGVGEKTAHKILKTRGESPFTLHSLCDLLRKDSHEIEKVVTFQEVQRQPDRSHDLSEMKRTMNLCNKRNAERAHESSDERREGSPASRYNINVHHRQYYSQFQEDRYREHAVSTTGLGSFTTVTSGRQYGYDSDESDDEPNHPNP
ncbi:general secretion pathway protein k-like protein [Plakobranchus ocellatus]|uniref:General secretion pathway protein k-like protein n=1 Tax=Plakobranchus ocellatus TaxID=259542 RepID=A0AAV4D603_9GAST|nr:general secretion pathway protein k-like protein [Plakobranchus ocellatus]